MSTPIQSGASSAPAIHHSTRFPVDRTFCGVTTTPKPATSRWQFVTCVQCLELGAMSEPAARARLEELARAADGTTALPE